MRTHKFLGKTKRFGDKYLLVNMDGSWIFLDEEEYKSFNRNDMSDELFDRLERNNVIYTDSNSQAIVDNYKSRKQILFQGTSLHIVIPTLRCNQRCKYCHAASKHEDAEGYDMDEETAKKTVDFIFQSPSEPITIEFQGGEPLLNFEIVKFITKYAKELNKKHKRDLKFSIVTNLTLMDKEKLKYLIDERIGICTSLDGPKKIHDKNRVFLDNKGSHGDVVKWIRKIMAELKKTEEKKYSPRLNALATVTKESLGHHKKIVDEYKKLGIKKIWFRFMNPLGFSEWEKYGYDADEFLEFWRKGVQYAYSQGLREMTTEIMLAKILARDPNYLDVLNPCGAAIGQLAYMHDGSIYSCDEGRMYGGDFFELGNVHENSYKDVLCSPKTCSLISSSVTENFLCDDCVYQTYCGVCPVWNHAAYGNVVPILSENMRCKILMGQFSYVFEKISKGERFGKPEKLFEK